MPMKKTQQEAMDQAKAEAVRILTEAVERAVGVLTRGSRRADSNALDTRATSAGSNELLDTPQLATRLTLPDRMAVYALLRERKIPCIRLGPRRLRFDLQKVLAALGRLEIKAASLTERR